MPAHGRPAGAAVDDEVVSLGLSRDRLVDRPLQELVAFRRAERGAQIRRVLLAEAHVKRAGAGDAHAVAALAEIMGERRDEAYPAARLRHLDIARRTAGPVAGLRHRKTLGEAGAYQRQRQVLIRPVAVDVA